MSATHENDRITEEVNLPQYNKFTVKNSLTHSDNLLFKVIPNAVGEGYAPYYYRYIRARHKLEGEKMRPEKYGNLVSDVAEKMLHDKFKARSTKFLVFDHTQHPSGEVAATSRFVPEDTKRYRGRPKLESITLTYPNTKGGWESVIEPNTKYGELSRVVVLKDFRRKGLTTAIVQEMVSGKNGIIQVAMEQEIEYILMVAKNKFRRHIEQTELEVVDRLPIELRSAGKRVAKTFPGYWLDPDDKPELVVTKVPQKAA